uniref:Protein kinase domain-containing protein n=1 Tax=Hucho hucho TaxID=62062 RepID=A0A4W5PB48_9TELE
MGQIGSKWSSLSKQAPEVLSGGPYSHAADWWSLGILLFSLVTGKFPVPPEPDHSNMLRKLLCKNPAHRLRSLECFKRQTFFRGTFDFQLLQKRPVELILELKNHPDRPAIAMRGLSLDYFQNFNCDILYCPTSPTDMSPTLANNDLSQTLATAQGFSA